MSCKKIKILSLLCASLCTLTLFTSCGEQIENLTTGALPDESQTYTFKSGETSTPTSYTSYKTAVNDFSFKMLKSLYQKSSTTAYSPVTLFSTLAQLEAGSAKQTYNQIKSLINKNTSTDKLCQSNGYFFARMKELCSKSNSYYVDLSNSMIFNKNAVVGSSFLTNNADYFNTNMYRLNYSDKTAVKDVNSLLNENSKNTVKNACTSLDNSKDITCFNTVFMKDQWLDGYKDSSVTTGTFNGADSSKSTKFMNSTEYYISGEKCTGFIKDFKNTPTRFIALLPNKNVSMKDFIKSLNAESYNIAIKSYSVFKTCKASMPEISVDKTLSFKELLQENGVKDIFSNDANLSSVSYNYKGSVSDIVQNFKLSINQKGASTSKTSYSKGTKKDPDKQVSLSRPFIFIIADNESNIPIYVGVVSNI